MRDNVFPLLFFLFHAPGSGTQLALRKVRSKVIATCVTTCCRFHEVTHKYLNAAGKGDMAVSMGHNIPQPTN